MNPRSRANSGRRSTTGDYEGVSYSLRAGPRQPLPTDHEWHPVAVYAPDEITEEEFQDWYALQQPTVEELRLKY